jgi:hypothetical protein
MAYQGVMVLMHVYFRPEDLLVDQLVSWKVVE